MTEERRRILDMLAKGKISVEEAEQLLAAIQDPATGPVSGSQENQETKRTPKFMYVKVISAEDDNVDVKVPLSLVRAGLRLTSLIPPQAMDHINEHMGKQGMSFDFSNLKPDDIEELIESLAEMEVNVDSKNGDNVRVYCE